jgi:hypothetical protein
MIYVEQYTNHYLILMTSTPSQTPVIPDPVGQMLDPTDSKISKIILDLFESDQIPDDFYRLVIAWMRGFTVELIARPDSETDDPKAWQMKGWADIWKGCLKVSGDLGEGDYPIIKQHIRGRFIHMFGAKRSKAIQKLNVVQNIYRFDIGDLERLTPGQYTTFVRFIVYGCYRSRDIDVMVICPPSSNYNGGVRALYTSELTRLSAELMAIGYDTQGRDIDYNQVVIEDGKIVASTKGGAETGNIVLITWIHHSQIWDYDAPSADTPPIPLALVQYPLDFVELGFEEFEAKVRSLAKYFWDFLKYCTTKADYMTIRSFKSDVYQMTDCQAVMTQLRVITPLIISDPEVAKSHDIEIDRWRSFFKTVVMKLVQIIVFDLDGTMTYVKDLIAQDSRKIVDAYPVPDQSPINSHTIESACLYYLTRGTEGHYEPTLFHYLLGIYFQIVDQVSTDRSTIFTVSPDVLRNPESYQCNAFPGLIGIDLMDLFLSSPRYASPGFESAWQSLEETQTGSDLSDRTINQRFIQTIEPSNQRLDELVSGRDMPPESIDVVGRQFIMTPQRSREWLHMLSDVYECGNNGAAIGTDFQAKFNLIRGSILEPMCTDLCPVFTDIKVLGQVVGKVESIDQTIMHGVQGLIAIETGLIVERIIESGTKPGTKPRGAAPDLLLICPRVLDSGVVTKPLMIPVEIKGLKEGGVSPIKNSDYRRGLSLAKRQIGSIKQIIDPRGFVIEFGLIVLCWISDGRLGMEVHAISL